MSQTLLNLLADRVGKGMIQLYKPATVPVTINYSLFPSDELTTDATVSLNLYHFTEDAALKNQSPTSASTELSPAQFNPMGLQLYYQLNVHEKSDRSTNDAMMRVHQLFGLAIKALHDCARIDHTPSWSKLPPGNIIRISLLHTTPEQAEQFWSSSTKPVRLSAYYMVTAVLLEPEMPTTIPGRVLDYEIKDFIIGAPRLDASTNTIKFTPPGGIERKLDLRPAEVPVGGSVDILGSGLGGNGTSLQISSGNWDAPVDVGGWITAGTSDRITVTIGTTAGAAPNIHNIVPGFYTAAARIPKGGVWQISNEVPFAIAPAVTIFNAGLVTPFTLILRGGVFSDPNLLPEHVRVILGSRQLTPDLYLITGPNEIHIQFPIAGVAPNPTVPLRIIVNGAESAPLWITVPTTP